MLEILKVEQSYDFVRINNRTRVGSITSPWEQKANLLAEADKKMYRNKMKNKH